MLASQYAHHLKRRSEGFQKKRADFVALLRPRDELREFGQDAVAQWRILMDDLNQEILQKLPEPIPDISESELVWAAQQMKLRS